MYRESQTYLRLGVTAAYAFAALLSLLASVSLAEVQQVQVECGSNTCFILCQPNIQSPEDAVAYVEQAHNRLAVADPSLTTEAVVTFVNPVSFDQVGGYVEGVTAENASVRVITESGNDLITTFPFNVEEPDSAYAPNTAGSVVSMRLTAEVSILTALSQDTTILCVDAGAIDQLDQHPNAMVIVLEDLYQMAAIPGTAGKATGVTLPEEYSLAQNYPNPFNPVTEISLSLPQTSKITLDVFNLLGQKVTTIYEGKLEAGTHSFNWDGSSVASGVYLYRLMADDFVETKKMILLK